MYISGIMTTGKCCSLNNKNITNFVERPNSSKLSQLQQLRDTNKYRKNKLSIKKQNTDHISKNKIGSLIKVNQENKRKKQFKEKLSSGIKNNKINKQSGILLKINSEQKIKIMSYFRLYPISILYGCGQKDIFMKKLAEKKELVTYNSNNRKITMNNNHIQCWNKLLKLAQLKGKYKYRQKFNYLHSGQLKAINYKHKEWKKKKQSSSSSSDQSCERKQKYRDMQSWKKTMGATTRQVFIIKGAYKDFRNALLERGWMQNDDKKSAFYDLKWTTKVNDINFDSLKPSQIVNHFNNNACLTSKYGLCKSLRSIMYSYNIDIDKFFPKAYDLSDLGDFQNFLEIYKWIYCESLLKFFMLQENKEKIDKNKVLIALIVIKRRLLSADILISSLMNSQYQLCSINEWAMLLDKPYDIQLIKETLKKWNISFHKQLQQHVQKTLLQLNQYDPQYKMNGYKNIWIVKPAFLSRGRGIKCLNNLSDIMDYSMGKETQYVVQKYIENPLIINHKKFDIRLWVIIEDYNPPKIWIFQQFYLRFCLDNYNDSKLNNKFAHLTNNAVQKNHKKCGNYSQLQSTMWDQITFQQYMGKHYGQNSFKGIKNKMKQIVIATIIASQDQVYARKSTFELIGYDFMIDTELNPWLIEINTSPSMDYSTTVTRKLVKMVMEDTVKVVIDLKLKKSKKKTAGLFKCVYNGQKPFLSTCYQIKTTNLQYK